ncbi:MAG: hypothetical protein ACD_48C00499G0001 [uncultured bacterium]|nr:MAG: hypothetical protein ACD_48C00499G0001 [uncultured bacterium]
MRNARYADHRLLSELVGMGNFMPAVRFLNARIQNKNRKQLTESVQNAEVT